MNSKSQYWIDSAEDNLETARVLLNGKRYLDAGFFCNLIIEKALKAVIAKDEAVTPPKIHHLPKLAKQGNIYSLMDDKQKDFLEILLPLNIEARYPSYKADVAATLDDEVCKDLVKRTEALLCWIKQQL